MRTRFVMAVLAVVLPAAVATVGTGSAVEATHATVHRSLVSHGVFRPATTGLLARSNASTTSLNWSGYDVNGTGITGVKSVFVVPTAKAVPAGFAANWAGIGGYSTTDLIQAGTSEDSSGTYYAWYEILPAPETQLTACAGDANCTVTPGDKVTVEIHNVGINVWSVNLTDAGRWTWSQNIPYVSSESSAEWILEAPSVGGVQTAVANVGTSYFGPTSTWTNATGAHTIAVGNPLSIAMSPGGVNEATPSALAPNGMSFNSCAYKQTCPAPRT